MRTDPDLPPAAPQAGVREWAGLVVLTLPALLIAVDFTVLHLAVPHLSAALAPTSTQLLWLVDIYGFAIAGLLITMGTLGDRIGRRRLLLIGGAAFAGASVLAAYAPSAELLIAARALLGITGATLLPSTLSLITVLFRDARQRQLAIAVWATSFLAGGVIGPLVGGALLEHFWWGSVFLLAVPVMLILLVAGPLVLPESRRAGTGRVDLASAVLLTAAILAVVYGIKQAAAGGSAGLVVLSVAAGTGIGLVFLRRQRRLPDPLLDLTLFSRRTFSVPLGAQFLGLFVLAAVQFYLMQYLQLVLDLSALEAGLWSLPAAGAGVVANLSAPMLARWFSPVRVIVAGLLVGLAGLMPIAAVAGGGDAALALAVTGFAVVNLALNPALVLSYDLILGSAPPERAGTASGTAETGNELGIALGVAIAGSVGAAVYRGRLAGDAIPAQVPPEAAATARDTLGGAVTVAEELADPVVAEQVLVAAREAFTAGMQVAAGVLAVLLAGMALTVAVLLRNARQPAAPVTDQPAAVGAGLSTRPPTEEVAP